MMYTNATLMGYPTDKISLFNACVCEDKNKSVFYINNGSHDLYVEEVALSDYCTGK